ncbi:MAG: sulfotransferase [Magnetococcales bacterium]|nr:sulfotransferase [Magnetococcales bacterium]
MRRILLPANLTNTFSTAMRILGSGNRIGLFQIVLNGSALLLFPLDRLLGWIQNRPIDPRTPCRLPIIFLTGYSRSGTTVIYQALTRVWREVEYCNNLVIPFPRAYPLVNSWYRRFTNRRDASLESFFGRTMGFCGTNDGPELFQHWFLGDEMTNRTALSEESRRLIKTFHVAHEHYLQHPFMIKNCTLYLHYSQLAEVLPNAHFIFIRRNPANIIDSIIRSREFIQGDKRKSWEVSIHRQPGEELVNDPITEIALNVRHSLALTESFRDSPHGKQLSIIDYEAFCADPAGCVESLTRTIFQRSLDDAGRQSLPDALPPQQTLRSSPADQATIHATVARWFPDDQTSRQQGAPSQHEEIHPS